MININQIYKNINNVTFITRRKNINAINISIFTITTKELSLEKCIKI